MQISREKLLTRLSLMEKSVVLLLNGADAAPIHGKTAYQKELFFVSNYDEKIGNAADFEPYLYGPHSEVAENAISTLISYGLAKEQDGYYFLTEEGKQIASILREKRDIDVDEIEDVKEFLNDMTREEIILFTYVNHPEYTDESQIRDKILKKRIPIAISLYKKGKVDLEMAAYLAGVSIEEFFDKIRGGKPV